MAADVAGRHRLGQQSCEGAIDKIAQALAFDEQPIFEGRIADIETLEEISAAKNGRLLDGFRRPVAQQLLKGRNVDDHGGRIDADRLTIGDDWRRYG